MSYTSRSLALFLHGQPTFFLLIFNHQVSKKSYSDSRTLQITCKLLFYWLKSADTINSSLSTKQKATLEGEVLEQIEEASANLRAVHAVLWKAYEGIVGVQDVFGKASHASRTVDTIHNKLSILRDAKEPAIVKDEDIDCKIDSEAKDTKNSDALK